MTDQISEADYLQMLEECDFIHPDGQALITGRYTEQKFSERVRERHFGCCDGYGYFSEFFDTEVWQDGQGQDEIREMYFHPSIPYSFNYFTRSMQICDPRSADECRTQYCQIPQGGYGNLPPMEMYKWGFETPRQCIANIRHIKQFREWAKRVVDTRFLVDQQVMQMFYTFAALRMTGHKFVLEAEVDANDNWSPYPDNNPRNPLGGWKYNFMEPLFPSVGDPQNIVPLSLDILKQLARRWSNFCNEAHVARGPRGEKIWEFWYPTDWYEEEILQDPEHMDRLRHFMPSKLFSGYSLDPRGEREIIGNWAMRPMPCLPRFAESCDGGLVPIDMHENVAVEINYESIESRQWLNAPFLMAGSFSPEMGTLLTRPTLNTSAEGWPILPIMGNGDWMIRNDYDKKCNPDLNMPYSQKRYEMGFRLDDPYASMAIIFRARKYRTAAINRCDLMPADFKVVPNEPCNNLMTIGCDDNREKAPTAVTETEKSTKITCSSQICGGPISTTDGGALTETLYRLEVPRKAYSEGFKSIPCDCGSSVFLEIHDEVGNTAFVQTGTIVEVLTPPESPYYKLWVSTAILPAGHCPKAILCQEGDDSPNYPNQATADVINCWGYDPDGPCDPFGGFKFQLSQPIRALDGDICGIGDTVNVQYFDAAGTLLGTIPATLADFDIGTCIYRITSSNVNFDCVGNANGDGFVGVESVRVVCA